MNDRKSVLVENLSFSYSGGFRISLDNLSMNRGEFTAILGPNGSGKSTLFSLIRGRLKAEKGSIRVHQRDIFSVNDRERASLVGLVPQLNETPFGFTVEDVVRMGAFRHEGFYGQPRNETDIKLNNILNDMDLAAFRNRSVDSLSGGEYQRVLLARVLLQDPQVLLLDEPANHLDLSHQESLLRLLREQALRGKTVIAILHDVNQALLHADRVVMMKDGNCAGAGRVEDVLTPDRVLQVYGTDMEYYHPSWPEGLPILGPGRRASCKESR